MVNLNPPPPSSLGYGKCKIIHWNLLSNSDPFNSKSLNLHLIPANKTRPFNFLICHNCQMWLPIRFSLSILLIFIPLIVWEEFSFYIGGNKSTTDFSLFFCLFPELQRVSSTPWTLLVNSSQCSTINSISVANNEFNSRCFVCFVSRAWEDSKIMFCLRIWINVEKGCSNISKGYWIISTSSLQLISCSASWVFIGRGVGELISLRNLPLHWSLYRIGAHSSVSLIIAA